MIVITDEYIKEHGFKEYNPTRFDNDSVILRFQKRYDDNFGKKYFIDILKWDNSYVPVHIHMRHKLRCLKIVRR